MLSALLLLALAQPPVVLADHKAFRREVLVPRQRILAVVFVAPGCTDCDALIPRLREAARAEQAEVLVVGWGPSDRAGLDYVVTDPAKLHRVVGLWEPDLSHPIVASFYRDGQRSLAVHGADARDISNTRAMIVAAWLARVVNVVDEKFVVTPSLEVQGLQEAVRDHVRKCADFEASKDPRPQRRSLSLTMMLPMPPSPTPLSPADVPPGSVAAELPPPGDAKGPTETNVSRCAARFPKLARFSVKLPTTPIVVDYTVTLDVKAAEWPPEWKGTIPSP